MVRFTDRPEMTLDVYRGRKITIQQQHITPRYEQLELGNTLILKVYSYTLIFFFLPRSLIATSKVHAL